MLLYRRTSSLKTLPRSRFTGIALVRMIQPSLSRLFSISQPSTVQSTTFKGPEELCSLWRSTEPRYHFGDSLLGNDFAHLYARRTCASAGPLPWTSSLPPCHYRFFSNAMHANGWCIPIGLGLVARGYICSSSASCKYSLLISHYYCADSHVQHPLGTLIPQS